MKLQILVNDRPFFANSTYRIFKFAELLEKWKIFKWHICCFRWVEHRVQALIILFFYQEGDHGGGPPQPPQRDGRILVTTQETEDECLPYEAALLTRYRQPTFQFFCADNKVRVYNFYRTKILAKNFVENSEPEPKLLKFRTSMQDWKAVVA